jgi:hypothetical protein
MIVSITKFHWLSSNFFKKSEKFPKKFFLVSGLNTNKKSSTLKNVSFPPCPIFRAEAVVYREQRTTTPEPPPPEKSPPSVVRTGGTGREEKSRFS